MNIKKLSVVGAIVMLGLVAYLVWKNMNQPDTQALVSGNGRIEATEINISSKLSGQLEEILVQEGDFVEAGQVLARIKVSTLEAQLREIQAQQRQAQDGIATAEAQVAMRISEKAAAAAMVEQRETELVAAKNRLARTEILAKDGAVSKQQLDDERADVKSVAAVLSAARAQVDSAQSAIVAARSQVSSAHSQVDAIKATIERINFDIEDAQLKAPLKARVQFLVAQPGEMIAAGGRVMNLIDLSDVYMTFFLPETVAGRIAIGTEVRIVLDAAKNVVIPAKVSFVADTAQFTPKTVETESERQKLMFRIKAKIDPVLLQKYIQQVKTGLPGVAYIKIDENAPWPAFLSNLVKS
ncbi:HlyD family efflux transporter periplasmic adaptor subunit [Acinetobacter sp. C_4_1]|uniref:HlyD family secretion protein n=1 Tax=unclassified Acinetobacter TaxID=196816 RepID=UPI0021B762F8|nr:MULTISPECIES: HlyD family efflux transporter periplasmic adaptor subunit [unclassified Acinetobacter]MCT8088337.1 HlyD family efflux transporter periplasmic adaptor subunit [Acinetobacter sp. F_3_1]MCT8097706.1 HlyD family efflux transporter periplasmic adaptor subunit [Acinetobacter sp. C_3_1]MCT8100362.1 HlyD family efflux transporter periplasmic adaptor subunit [Acinetobacter sp. C_4_1]MCT8133919.1 HlyD family efflux transporter periplasmic adaptor subunit [Acinetobacter sp. T_3_1]